MNRWCSFGLAAAAGVSACLLASTPSWTQSQLAISTSPPLDQVLPFKQPMQVSLQVRDGAGESREEATVQIQLVAPAKTPWLTTDFPIVEGTTLLEAAIATADGSAQLQLMPPIRGRYHLEAWVVPRQGGTLTAFTETLTLQVPENPDKYHNLLILLAILGVAGFGGGWVIGGSQRLEEGEVAPQPVRLLLSVAILVAIGALIYITITAEMADAHVNHGSDQGSEAPISSVEAQPHPDALAVSLEDLAVARVGQAIPLAVAVADAATGQPVTDIHLAIATEMLDYNQTVMAFAAVPDDAGRYTWKQQFFDGSPHLVTVRVSPQANAAVQFEPFDLVKRIEVEGVAPPVTVRLLSLSYLTAVLAAGVGAGFWTRRRLQHPAP